MRAVMSDPSQRCCEPTHRLTHQLRRTAQIPLRVGDVHMAEVGRQDGQSALGILIGPIPLNERVCRESMPHVVQTRSAIVGRAAQTDLSGQRIKGSMNVSAIQAIPPTGDEQNRRRPPSCPMAIAPAM